MQEKNSLDPQGKITMTKLKQHELRAYVSREDYRQLEQEATNRGLSLSKTVRDCLREYLALRKEMATALKVPGAVGEAHTGAIIHTLLARTEERIASAIDKQAERLQVLEDQLLIQSAMVDKSYLGIMQHLPEVPEALTESSIASAKRRHHKWLEAVQKFLDAGEASTISYYPDE
jgi:hypothetical protein